VNFGDLFLFVIGHWSTGVFSLSLPTHSQSSTFWLTALHWLALITNILPHHQ